jgi:Zn-dependent protease
MIGRPPICGRSTKSYAAYPTKFYLADQSSTELETMGNAYKVPYDQYQPSGKTFSRKEIQDIVISITAITFIFAISFSDLTSHLDDPDLVDRFLYWLGIAASVTILGFLLHEMAHKFVARRYNAWAEFRMYPMGLLLGFVTALLGFTLIAPGAVNIAGTITKEQYGRISLAGPAMNIVIGSVFLVAWLALDDGGLLSESLNIMAYLSLILAVFNLLPIPPLDGSKVVRWNIPIYLLVMAMAIILALISYGIIEI